ncbi:MAG: 50S ribosomal protein L13 [Candidatus Omnitrophica bacterium]|nr:50S ribosomal protein L13 [Candidatus Omnitrophota bacterium]
MKKTYVAKRQDIKRSWYLVDAKDKVLGRIAVKAAVILRGKHKAIFTPSIDTGDGVIVINASQVKVTGRKLKQKVYRRYSGYPGGLREVGLENMLNNKPATVMKLAIRRMLPKGTLGNKMIKKLKVFADSNYPKLNPAPLSLEV